MEEYAIKNNDIEQRFFSWREAEERLQELTDMANENGYDVLVYQKMIRQAKESHYIDFDEWLINENSDKIYNDTIDSMRKIN